MSSTVNPVFEEAIMPTVADLMSVGNEIIEITSEPQVN